MEFMNVRGPEFKPYGRVIDGYDVSGLMEAMAVTPLPGGVAYVASVPELEALPIAAELADGIYGQMAIQVGYCNGHNRKLNALEYHRDSEVNLAVKDLVLLLGRRQDVTEEYTYDTSKVEAFLVPAGTMVEVYATTLHYAPCQTGKDGFKCVVALPKGTNTDLDCKPALRCGEERLLAAKNKWLIGHEEGGLEQGAWIGLEGENISL